MRKLERFDSEEQAGALADVLLGAGIRCSTLPSREGGTDVWVEDERRMNEARAFSAELKRNPASASLNDARRRAGEVRKAQEQRERAARGRVIQVRARFSVSGRMGPVTLLLVLACVLVAVLTTSSKGLARLDIGDRTEVVSWLSFQSYVLEGGYYRWFARLPDLAHGQIWRLFTPSLLHFGLLHIVFNLWWLIDLGGKVEQRQPSWLLLLLVLVLSGLSNSAQFLLGASPAFGGMSGVVYGLFGYVWVRGRFDPASGYAVGTQNVIWMLGFFALCWTGLLGPVANFAHAAGLGIGALWGYLASGALGRVSRR